jgi:hypothetical protein
MEHRFVIRKSEFVGGCTAILGSLALLPRLGKYSILSAFVAVSDDNEIASLNTTRFVVPETIGNSVQNELTRPRMMDSSTDDVRCTGFSPVFSELYSKMKLCIGEGLSGATWAERVTCSHCGQGRLAFMRGNVGVSSMTSRLTAMSEDRSRARLAKRVVRFDDWTVGAVGAARGLDEIIPATISSRAITVAGLHIKRLGQPFFWGVFWLNDVRGTVKADCFSLVVGGFSRALAYCLARMRPAFLLVLLKHLECLLRAQGLVSLIFREPLFRSTEPLLVTV